MRFFQVLQCPPNIPKLAGTWISCTKLPLVVKSCEWCDITVSVSFGLCSCFTSSVLQIQTVHRDPDQNTKFKMSECELYKFMGYNTVVIVLTIV